ncbi:hypothetical protein SSX86_032898 [Deinandra increscens subsp. villosa]|uniref:PRA1 family protein n=1 Tax=Deinandra increscens subsp. villosa TaxID=3103831 RepID=A0AAP0C2E0_9ASTR
MASPMMKVNVKPTTSSRPPQSPTSRSQPMPHRPQPAIPRSHHPDLRPPQSITPRSDHPDLRPFFSRLLASLRNSFSQRRPWSELVDRSTLSRPDTFSETTSRIRKNISYFRVNYAAIIALLTLLSLLSHPFPLFFLASLLAAWIYLYLFRPPDQPVFLYDRTFSDREILGILIISTIMIVFLTGLGSLLISSVVFGFGITCVHGAFRVPQEVFAEDQEQIDTGFLSYVIGTAASAAVSTAPTVPRAGPRV